MLARSGEAELCTLAPGCPVRAFLTEACTLPASPWAARWYLGPGAPQQLWTGWPASQDPSVPSSAFLPLPRPAPGPFPAPWATPGLHSSPSSRSGRRVILTSLPAVCLSPAGRDPSSCTYPPTLGTSPSTPCPAGLSAPSRSGVGTRARGLAGAWEPPCEAAGASRQRHILPSVLQLPQAWLPAPGISSSDILSKDQLLPHETFSVQLSP